MSSRLPVAFVVFLFGIGSALRLGAQNAAKELPEAPQPQPAGAAAQSSVDKDTVTLRRIPISVLKDQGAIWSSPVRIREHDLALLVPLALATTVTITTDHQVMSSPKLDDTSLNNEAGTASNGLVGGFIAAPAIVYGLGYLHHDEHATETGKLSAVAVLDSLIVEEGMKLVSMRERPAVDNAKGKFFQSNVGFDSSFPSSHSVVAWSAAAVLASEYRGPFTQITAYGLATGVSVTRILARQHFPSDVVVGSAVGWLIGRYVFHKHAKTENAY